MQQLESSLIERGLKGKGQCKDIVTRRRMEDWKKVITSHNFHYMYVNLDRLCNLDMDFESN
jgi:hypothetical protein